MVANNLVEELISAVKPDEEKRNTTYSAIVTRVDKDGTAWVCIAGSEKETPVASSVTEVRRGDMVNVEWRHNRIYIAGNWTNPSAGQQHVFAAEETASGAHEAAASAEVTAETAQDTAGNAKRTAEAILIYDHTYELSADEETGHLIATFTAYLYQGGIDIKSRYPEEWFTWYLKTEDGEEQILNAQGNNYGYTCTIDTTTCGYGAEVIGKFTTTEDSELLTADDDTLTNASNTPITARTSTGDTVRVRDLTVSTTIYPTDKVMMVGAEDEHLVTVSTLSDAVDKHYTHTQATPSDTWTITHNLRKRPSITVVDSAGTEVVGDCDYVDENTVVLTFTGGFAGNAYLN